MSCIRPRSTLAAAAILAAALLAPTVASAQTMCARARARIHRARRTMAHQGVAKGMNVNARGIARAGHRPAWWVRMAMVAAVAWWPAASAHAAQVQHLNTQSATASGAGAAGTPTMASFNIPSGKNRALFIWVSFERDHCTPTEDLAGLCTNGNVAGAGLGDNWPEPRIGIPPATTTNSQLTARVVGPGGTINKQNALVIGGTPSGDTRFIVISSSPSGSPAGTASFSVSSFHIVLFENEINTLLGGAASGTVTISLPDASTPASAGDEAMIVASVFQNVEQTVTGFVRNATATAQVTSGTPGNSNLAPAAYDAGQAPDEADDGKLVTGASASPLGFLTPAGHTGLATPSITNAGGIYDTSYGNVNVEPNGFSGALYFRNGGATPGSLYTLTMAGAAATLEYGASNASFLLESDNADVGDAPISYGNPTHTLSGIRLGASVDADASLLNSPTATGDDTNNTDDEDGVTLTPLLPIGQVTVVPVSIQNGSGFLSAWFDWNADGDFNDAGEQMVAAQAVAAGTLNLNISVPAGAVVGPTFARFRVCTNNVALDNCNTPAGTVQSGEVEDYQFQVGRTLLLRKTTLQGSGGPFGFTLTNTVQATGTVTTAAVNTPTQVDGDTGTAGTQVFTITSPTTAVTITESSLPATWSLTGVSCTNGSGAPVGSLAGATYTITGAEIAASTNFTCTFTNTRQPQADLRLTKTNTPGTNGEVDQGGDTVVSGTSTQYVLTVTNLGPDAADGAVVADPPATGATCATASCTASGGATCPAPTGAALAGALHGAGAVIPTLPAGGAVQITLVCTIN